MRCYIVNIHQIQKLFRTVFSIPSCKCSYLCVSTCLALSVGSAICSEMVLLGQSAPPFLCPPLPSCFCYKPMAALPGWLATGFRWVYPCLLPISGGLLQRLSLAPVRAAVILVCLLFILLAFFSVRPQRSLKKEGSHLLCCPEKTVQIFLHLTASSPFMHQYEKLEKCSLFDGLCK